MRMFDNIYRFVELAIEFFGTQLVTVLAYPLFPTQRIFWLYLCSSAAFAFYVFFITSRSADAHKMSIKGFIRFLFPKDVWQNPSAWLDVRYFFFHQMFRVIIYTVFLTGVTNLVFQMITGGPNLFDASRLTIDSPISDMAIATAYMFVLMAAGDFVAYGIHYMQHRVPLLWEFHKVHHSLEVMHPLSNYREHPVDNIVYAAAVGAAYGLVMGSTSSLFGYLPSVPQLLGIPLVMFAFNILGYNLRHSHIWLRWPGRCAMAFASPAHHQIHHSCHPDHIDKNFAFIFPCWDVLFGTYEIPETNKDVRFGMAVGYVNEYKSCLGMYFIPFRNLWQKLTHRSGASL